jgi:phytol kinase
MIGMIASAIQQIFDFFFVDHFPPIRLIWWLLPLCLMYVMASLQLGSFCRSTLNCKVGYTRKLFHFLMFGAAGLLQVWGSIPAVFILGWAITAVLTVVLFKGEKSAWYQTLARPSDAPSESRYIIYPYLATFGGGVLANLLFGPAAAIAGYLVTGFGDAIGEPVGTRWGKHRYKVPGYGSSIVSYRSFEGSSAVFIASVFAFLMATLLGGFDIHWFRIFSAALLAALVEGLSPHGWDNFSSQLAGGFLALYWVY